MPKAEGSMDADKSVSKSSELKSHRTGKTSTHHDCTICNKSNLTLSGLKIHLLTHSGEKPFLCSICDKRFTCSSNLKKHLRIHNKDYIYRCEICGKTCSDPSNMKKHMTVHSGEKAYVCPSCGKSYSYAQSLRQHMDDAHVENGEKRMKSKRKGHFPCPECGKVFGYYWRCTLHQARIHAVNRPFKCPQCEKSFARETILNKHLQTHEKPYDCTQCERRFSFRDQLHKHFRTHSGERPYQCETCLKSFSQRGSLTEHMRTHTGLKPFACKICGTKFASSSSLRRHERKVKSCFPAPEGEEIPMVDMYPRKAIYVPSPPVNIPRFETRPVIGTQAVQTPYTEENLYGRQNLYMNENSRLEETSCKEQKLYLGENSYVQEKTYIRENPGSRNVVQSSTANALSIINGPSSAMESNSATKSNESSDRLPNQTGRNVDVNNNIKAPTSQISMVVRCDKNGKISVLPVTLQIVNSNSKFACTNSSSTTSLTENAPVVAMAPTDQPYQPNSTPSSGQEKLAELAKEVTMATSTHHPSVTYIPSGAIQQSILVNSNNMVSSSINVHLPDKHSPVNTILAKKTCISSGKPTNSTKSLNKTLSGLTETSKNIAMFAYGDMLTQNPLLTTNGLHRELPPRTQLHSFMTTPMSTVMELSTTQPSIVKKEPGDIKPVIGIDVPAFNQQSCNSI